jgi:hypothetical protein
VATVASENVLTKCTAETLPAIIGVIVWIPPQQRAYLLDCFRGLHAALDEHKAKGTPPGSPVYATIHEQLTEDIAAIGFGRDDVLVAASVVGQLSTYVRLESLMPKELGPEEQEAICRLKSMR